jgi:hypothetical protein
MKIKLTLLATLSILSCASHAAETPFYQITEVSGNKAGNYGPWPTTMAADKTVSMSAVVNDWSQYYNIAPMSMDLANRYRFDVDCDYQMASDICDGFWSGGVNRAKAWRQSVVSYVPQDESILNGTSRTEQDGIIKHLGEDADHYVGYKIADTATNGFYHERKGFAHLGLNDIELSAPSSFDGVGGFTTASTLLALSDGSYLVGGGANTSVAGPNSALSRCYQGDTDQNSDLDYCPGFNTQAALWLINPDQTSAEVALAPAYYQHDSGLLETASVTGLADQGDGSYLAVGYSSTNQAGSSYLSGRNVAVTWPVTFTDGKPTFGALSLIPLPWKAPGEDKEYLNDTWAVAANAQGYVIGNQKYSEVKSRNKPIEMFVYDSKNGTTLVPFADKPAKGQNSEAAAINAVGQVVGWQDERNETQPVYNGSPRLQEAFLYNIGTKNSWRFNDLICSSSGTTTSCAQNGKYYYIVYASAVHDDGTVAATSYRYDSYTDWAKRQNATVVPVILTPQTTFSADSDVPADYVVTNALPANDLGQNNGSGAIPLWLLVVFPLLSWYRKRKLINKMS